MAAPKVRRTRALISAVRDWPEEHELTLKWSSVAPEVRMLVLILLLAAPSGWLLWKLPQMQMEGYPAFVLHGDPAKQIELEDTLRKTDTQIVLGAFGLLLLCFNWRRARAGDATVRIMEQGHITERFTKAIEQLGALDSTGKPNIEVRLGAIYALERIAFDSARDHWSIMEILTAYVRQNAPNPSAALAATGPEPEATPPGQASETLKQPRTEVQAILTVLGRRKHNRKRERPDHRLDLRHTSLSKAAMGDFYLKKAMLSRANLQEALLRKANLQDANLSGADLQGAQLAGADLQGADLRGANLEDANLLRANLQDADLFGANLEHADLSEANLQEAKLFGATLRDADLRQANLQGADLWEVDFREAHSLYSPQIRSATRWHEAKYSDEMRKELGLPDEALQRR